MARAKKEESTALAIVESKPTALIPRNMPEALEMAKLLAQSSIIPTVFRGKPADIFVALEFGAELGMPPMASLRNIHVVEGKPGLAAQAAQGVCLAQPDCEGFYRVESECKDGSIAVWVCKRKGIEHRGKFTIEQAKTAGLTGKDNWKHYPDDMINNRAIMRAARRAYPDRLGGIYSEQEIIDLRETEPDRFVAPPPPASAPPVSSNGNGGAQTIIDAVIVEPAAAPPPASVPAAAPEAEPEDEAADEEQAAAAQLDADVARTASLIETAQNEAELELVVPSCQTIKNKDLQRGKILLEKYLAKRNELRAPKSQAQPEGGA